MKNKIIAIIPARGGSKGLTRKNIRLLLDKPLIYYSIKAAEKSKFIDKIYVSTDDEEINRISKSFNCKVIKRPKDIAKDTTPMVEVLKHALKILKDENLPDVVVLLQPTSPLRKELTIDLACETFCKNIDNFDSLIPLYPIEGKIGTIKNGNYKPCYKLGKRRQDIEKVYRECGTIFIFKSDLIKKGKLFGKKIMPFFIKNYEEAIDIDDIEDLKLAEYFMRKRNENLK